MNDLDDTKLKAELDEIMKSIDNIMKKIESVNPVKKEESEYNED